MHGSRVNGIANMSLHTACGAMALTLLKTEPNIQVIGVDTSIQHLTISASQRLDDVVRTLKGIGGGGTDLSLPMAYALQKKLHVDAFVILTDSESWRSTHPSLLVNQYRNTINPEAKIVNVQMTATHVTNNDPNDRRALDCVGFDTNVPSIISSFLTGEL
jgi:60 kDa SS-A/Ro ribonucleoprotein